MRFGGPKIAKITPANDFRFMTSAQITKQLDRDSSGDCNAGVTATINDGDVRLFGAVRIVRK